MIHYRLQTSEMRMGYFKHAGECCGAGVGVIENAGLMGVVLSETSKLSKEWWMSAILNWVVLKDMQIKEHAHGKGRKVSRL